MPAKRKKKKVFRKAGVMKIKLTKQQLKQILKAARGSRTARIAPPYIHVPIFEPKNAPFKLRPAAF